MPSRASSWPEPGGGHGERRSVARASTRSTRTPAGASPWPGTLPVGVRSAGRRIRYPEGSADTVAAMSEHSMSERIEQLQKRKEEALHAGSERSVERQHAKGKLLARERIEFLLDPGSFHELDMLARHRVPADLHRGAALHRRRHHRLGHDRRPQGLRVLAGLHRVRRRPRRGVRREDPQGDGPRPVGRRAAHRPQRRRRRPHPGRRRLAGQLRRHLPPQRAGVGRHARRSAWCSARAPAARSTARP